MFAMPTTLVFKLSEMTKESAEKLYAVEKKPVTKYHTFSFKSAHWKKGNGPS